MQRADTDSCSAAGWLLNIWSGLGPQARDQTSDSAVKLAMFLGRPLERTIVDGRAQLG